MIKRAEKVILGSQRGVCRFFSVVFMDVEGRLMARVTFHTVICSTWSYRRGAGEALNILVSLSLYEWFNLHTSLSKSVWARHDLETHLAQSAISFGRSSKDVGGERERLEKERDREG